MTDNVAKSVQIIDIIQGMKANDGLTSLSLALIHVASHVGFSKEQTLDALGIQWDQYMELKAEREANGDTEH